MLMIQLIIVVFCLIAAVRSAARYRTGAVSIGECLIWIIFWLSGAAVVLMPQATQILAKFLGVGRGADAVFYLGLVGLSYGLFRIYFKIRSLEQQLTQLVRKLALEKLNTPDKTQAASDENITD